MYAIININDTNTEQNEATCLRKAVVIFFIVSSFRMASVVCWMSIVSWSSFIVILSILFKTCPLWTINILILMWCSSRYLSSFFLLSRFFSFVFYYFRKFPSEFELYHLLCLQTIIPLWHACCYLLFIFCRNALKSLFLSKSIQENKIIFIFQRIIIGFNEKRTK